MSYQVLARKWRPAKFAELVGQEHVKSALVNGLDHQRLHHAYLFTGTRGVGKTSIARIFAKSLNCETGVSAEPCGQCQTCVDVDAGRFVDLIEIDAASRTKVQDTREILDNVQYAPSRGRYKIYLIDEVHMLSRHSFNALLKTLEEPPEHVKFLLATTDPQKLPVTILSRCLQFNLQALTQSQIEQQLIYILQQESIHFEQEAVSLLAKYARGSMRDALSLTDQAIAQSASNLQVAAVRSMLGTVDTSWSQNILAAIFQQNAEALVEHLAAIERQHPDVSRLVDDLIGLCHQIAMTQILPSAAKLDAENQSFIQQVATQISPQEIQVYYQLLLQGKKELPFAPDVMTGLEMTCLRLMAFTPAEQFQSSSNTDAEGVKKNSIKIAIEAPKPQERAPQSHRDTNELASPDEALEQSAAENTAQNSDESLSQNSDNSYLTASTQYKQQILQQETEQKNAQKNEQVPADTTSTQTSESPSNSVEHKQSTEPPQINNQQPAPVEVMAQPLVQQDYHPPLDSYQDVQIDDEEAEQLFNQQNFVEQVAQSQGFSAPAQQIADESEAELVAVPDFDETSVDENPVLAILARRGQSVNSEQNQNESPDENPNVNNARNEGENSSELNTKQAQQTSEHSGNSETSSDAEQAEEDQPVELMPIEHEEVRYAHQVDQWAQMIQDSELAGLGRQLALNSEVEIAGQQINLTVKQEFAHLLNERSETDLRQIVSKLAPDSEFSIHRAEATQMSPSDIQKNINANRQERAEQSIETDPFVQQMVNEFGAQVVQGSIIPR